MVEYKSEIRNDIVSGGRGSFANSDGTLTPELMAVNPESLCRTSKVAKISHGPSVRHSHARWASGEGTDS